jgi:hypothetical protein
MTRSYTEYVSRRAGKTDATVQEMRRRGGGTVVVLPQHARDWAERLEAEGATVVVTIAADWPHASEQTQGPQR